MELIFLGSGGGRINLLRQMRATGGFRINSLSANIHVDPGPGALLNSIKFGQDPLALDAVMVSHIHIDHSSDAMVLVEALSHYTLRQQGLLIGSREAILGDQSGDRAVHLHHQSLLHEVYVAQFYEKKRFHTKKGFFDLEIYPMKHEEPSTFGFKLVLDGSTLGYISDTEFMPSLCTDFVGCDCLIINCLKPESDRYDGHLTVNEVVSILKETKPKRAVISHMGIKFLRSGPDRVAAKVTLESGVPTIAASDGLKLNL